MRSPGLDWLAENLRAQAYFNPIFCSTALCWHPVQGLEDSNVQFFSISWCLRASCWKASHAVAETKATLLMLCL